ncbi:MAG: hypothetical protein G8345_07855 [Magnetococcales bacterium]|nr:hypothetical protein [Magnetococcales bacterium]NGZ26789.1 hypothetical protein [Magnetococcales bacterium]
MFHSTRLLALLMALLVPAYLGAASKLEIAADKLDMDERSRVATFSGNVQAHDQEMKLSAEKMVVRYFGDDNQANKGVRDVKAEGNVVIRVGDREGRGDSAFYKVQENTMELTSNRGKATILRGDDRLEGKRIVLYLTKDRKIERVSVQGGEGRVSARITPPESGGGRGKTSDKE